LIRTRFEGINELLGQLALNVGVANGVVVAARAGEEVRKRVLHAALH
jgi:hypothetical protein